MTVASSTSRAAYSGNGVTTEFTVPFRFLEDGHLTVILVEADGTEVEQTIGDQYTVAGAGDASGTVTMLAAPAVGEQIVILRNVPLTQTRDYVTGDKFPAEGHEQALDKLTMICQQLSERLARALVIPASADASELDELIAGVLVLKEIVDEITTVAARDEDIGTVAARDADIGTVVDRDADIGTVAARDTDIGTVADRDADIAAVAANATNINTVAARDADIGTVADRDADIGTVAARDADVGTVADRDADIGTLAAISAALETVAAISSQIETLAALDTEITALGTRTTKIDALYAELASINSKMSVDGANADIAALTFSETATPANPAANKFKLYFKADGKPYYLDESGGETEIGGGSVDLGKQTIWVPASAMIPNTTNGAAPGTVETANGAMFKTLDFDATTQEGACFSVAMPKSWDEGTISFIPYWSHPSTVTNFGVVFELAGRAFSDSDAWNAAFGTAQTSADAGGTTDDVFIGPESSAITIGGSPAENDLVLFRIRRVPSNGSDTMAVDARLIGIKLLFTINSLKDN